MAQIVDKTTYTNFWQNEIQVKNIALQGFTMLDENEALQGIKAGTVNTPFMVLFPPDFKPIDRGSENVQRVVSWGFFILKRAENKKDLAEIKTIKNDCLQIAEQILGKLINLKEERVFFGGYDPNTTDYTEVGQLYDNHYGYQVFGDFITNQRIKHDAANWTP